MDKSYLRLSFILKIFTQALKTRRIEKKLLKQDYRLLMENQLPFVTVEINMKNRDCNIKYPLDILGIIFHDT